MLKDAGVPFAAYFLAGFPTEKAKKDLGFEVTIQLEEGLKEIIKWKANQI